MADGTRIDLIEKNGLFYLRLEQIFEPDEIRAMVAMTPPHQRPPILKGKMALELVWICGIADFISHRNGFK